MSDASQLRRTPRRMGQSSCHAPGRGWARPIFHSSPVYAITNVHSNHHTAKSKDWRDCGSVRWHTGGFKNVLSVDSGSGLARFGSSCGTLLVTTYPFLFRPPPNTQSHHSSSLAMVGSRGCPVVRNRTKVTRIYA